jgi:2'-5' RNA ligase
MAHQSAIIIPVPEVEPILGPLRLKYDPSAKLGVPAHITLLFPFCSAQAVNAEVEALGKVCSSIELFSFSLAEVRRFTATAYLHPDKSETFAQITKMLIRKWPEYEPYAGVHREIIPHLTIADQVGSETLDVVEEIARRQIPIRCVAREIVLLASDHAGIWSTKAVFSLTEKRKAR